MADSAFTLLRLSPLLLAASLLAGCNGYVVRQRNVFADDRGNVVTVDYAHSEKDHVNSFVSPVTGEKMDFRSKLLVLATLPDGDTFKAWQCMNFLRSGTLYKSDDEEWMFLANGFSCLVYRQTPEDPTRYCEVYRGVLCDSPKVDVRKDDRWKVLPRSDGKYEKGAGVK